MNWLDVHHVHRGTLDGAVELANRLYWALSVEEANGYWFVYGGEDLLLKTEKREVVDAFLYGFGLAYGCLPEEVLDATTAELKRLVGE